MSDSDIVREFLVESYENLDRLDRELVGLEKDPSDTNALASVFRTIHTIKGTCGFLAFNKLEAVAHVGENLLTRLRDRQLVLNPEITTALLGMVDAVRQMLSSIEAGGQEGERDDTALITTLTRLQQPQVPVFQATPVTEAPATEPVPGPVEVPAKVAPEALLGEILTQQSGVAPKDVREALHEQNNGDPRRVGEILVDKNVARPAEVAEAVQAQQAARGQAASDSTIRVDVGLLERLMTLVGELVLARNQVLQFTSRMKDSAFLATSQRLNLITTELQESVMKTRLQPIGNIWSKFPRTVRDVALNCGKEVRIEMEGKETELDKTIIEAIKDPLTHLVRNAVDHGIGTPEVRRSRGKDPAGRLYLHAFHEGGQVNIEISDDGAGLDHEKIRQKALEKSLISPERAARMSERESANLIFLPGFSTAAKVTNVSGRGVGMDVVKTNIEKIGGTVDVHSIVGSGTTVRMKIPLTLAIIPALIVSSSGDRYAIPQVSLLELVRLDAGQARTGIELVHGAPVYRLRGRLLPLVYLDRELRPGIAGQTSQDAINIVVLQADERQFGLVVDGVNDTEEIVVKALSKQLKVMNVFAGASIMGDGKVALILDVLGLAQRASVVTEVKDHSVSGKAATQAGVVVEKHRFLLFAGPGQSRMAIPLDTLARLEELPSSHVEKAGTDWVAQYRGQILPLVNLEFAMQERRRHRQQTKFAANSTDAPLQVLVCNHHGRAVGLVVEQILDIVEDAAELKYPASRTGVLYSTVINERVTELLDIPTILSTAGIASSEPARAAEAAV
jgi:two-component system chemotaxis sensor kinase CheA